MVTTLHGKREPGSYGRREVARAGNASPVDAVGPGIEEEPIRPRCCSS